ncbi:MAG: alpha/beta hydrolase [Alphaproteobacteria bacterium]|nr:alpha/beta hydrolase [Alphaproteobacteria bacterium]
MPLDPLVKAFLDQAAAIPRPKPWQMPPSVARASFAGMMGLVGPQNVAVGKVENFSIPVGTAGPGPAREIPARAYAPVAVGGEPRPALIFFHGGGFVVGGLDTHDGLCRLICAEGNFRVIAIDYRLAPEHPFPAAIDDAFAATQWIAANATQLGVDPGRIAVGGDSAGGMLAAIVAQVARDKGPKLAFQLLMFPNTQMDGETRSLNEYAVGYFLERHTIEWFNSQYAPKEADRALSLVSPLRTKDFSRLPPAYVLLGGYDPLHDEGLAYAEKLRGAGVPVTIADYRDMVHCFIYLQTVLPQAHTALAEAAHAVSAALESA